MKYRYKKMGSMGFLHMTAIYISYQISFKLISWNDIWNFAMHSYDLKFLETSVLSIEIPCLSFTYIKTHLFQSRFNDIRNDNLNFKINTAGLFNFVFQK